LVLILRDGNRYEDISDQNSRTLKKSLSHLNFKQLQVNIPLDDFKMKRTNEEAFKNHGEMLNVWQIDSVVDSTKHILNRRYTSLCKQNLNSFFSRTSTFLNITTKFPNVNIARFYDSLGVNDYNMLLQNALNISRTNAGSIDHFMTLNEGEKKDIKEYLMEWHKKIVVCFACIVLFFIGVPLGSIIKKGGLGLPVIVSVLFFLLYYILTEMFNSLALDEKLPPWQASWAPVVLFIPISIFLTFKAANDSVIFDLTNYYTLIGKLFKKKERV
jgi:lipopolysaccharide export system permease protein